MRRLTPPLGATRRRSFFALLPVRIGRDTRWLERVTVVERWSQCRTRSAWVREGFVDR